jgi:2,3-bisphosphoglycerate-dependent phosphoglycerate mutase
MELLIIRHALPLRIENTDGTAADPALAPDGVKQAQLLGEWLRDEQIDQLYVSPMQRARQTAEPVAEATGLTIQLNDGLAEWDRASATYIPIEEIKAANDGSWERFLAGQFGGDYDLVAFRKQVVETIEAIISAHSGQRVALVCHGGVINSYASHVLDIDSGPGFFHPHYTSINRIIAASSGERSIGSLNEVAHLRGTGLLR